MKKLKIPHPKIITKLFMEVKYSKAVIPLIVITAILASCLELQTASKDAMANSRRMDKYDLFIYVVEKISAANFVLLNNMLSLYLINEAFRVAMKNYFSEYMDLTYLDFQELGSGAVQFAIRRRSKALISFSKIICIRFIYETIYLSIILSKITGSISLTAILRSLGVILFFSFVIFLLQMKRTRLRRYINAAEERNGAKTLDILLNYERIKAYDNDKAELEKYEEVLQDFAFLNSIYEGACAFLQYLIQIMFMLVINIMLLCLHEDDTTTYDTFQKIIFMSVHLKHVLSDIIGDINNVYTSYLNLKQTRLRKKKKDKSAQKFYMMKFYNSIDVVNLSLKIGNQRILKTISCKIHKGEKVAICGENSAGKTLFMKCLLGSFNYKGAILYDGFEQKQIIEKSLLRNIAYVPQDPILFNLSLIENLKLGNKKADDVQILELCQRYKMHGLFHDLGYFNSVGTRGDKLSGGQKQKVLFMRAMVKNAPIFFFDQAMSNVDTKTEKFLYETMDSTLNDVTIISSVKNLNLLSYFDRVLFFEKGRLVANGPFEKLCKTNKEFAKFYHNSQENEAF